MLWVVTSGPLDRLLVLQVVLIVVVLIARTVVRVLLVSRSSTNSGLPSYHVHRHKNNTKIIVQDRHTINNSSTNSSTSSVNELSKQRINNKINMVISSRVCTVLVRVGP